MAIYKGKKTFKLKMSKELCKITPKPWKKVGL